MGRGAERSVTQEGCLSGSGDTPIHDWLQPRLQALVDEALHKGFDREAVVAVITDLITSPPFDTALPLETE